MCIRKRLSVWLICVMTAAAVLAGCSSSGSPSPKQVAAKKDDSAGGSTDGTAAEEAPEEEQSQESAAGDGAAGSGQDSSGGNGSDSASKGADTTIEEQVLYDGDGIRITAKEYVTDSIWGDGIKVLLENDTDNDIMGMSAASRSISTLMIRTLTIPYSRANTLRSRLRRSTEWIPRPMTTAWSSTTRMISGS